MEQHLIRKEINNFFLLDFSSVILINIVLVTSIVGFLLSSIFLFLYWLQ